MCAIGIYAFPNGCKYRLGVIPGQKTYGNGSQWMEFELIGYNLHQTQSDGVWYVKLVFKLILRKVL